MRKGEFGVKSGLFLQTLFMAVVILIVSSVPAIAGAVITYLIKPPEWVGILLVLAIGVPVIWFNYRNTEALSSLAESLFPIGIGPGDYDGAELPRLELENLRLKLCNTGLKLNVLGLQCRILLLQLNELTPRVAEIISTLKKRNEGCDKPEDPGDVRYVHTAFPPKPDTTTRRLS